MVTSRHSRQSDLAHSPIARLTPLLPGVGALALILIVFITSNGALLSPTQGNTPTQVPTSWVDVVLILGGGLAAAAMVIRRHSGGGTLSFSLFLAVAALSAISIAWSVVPDQTWEETGRTLAYVAALGIGLVIARRAAAEPGATGTRAAVQALTLAAVGISAWGMALKSFDFCLYGQPQYGRVVGPFDYWNATGLAAAIALPGCLHLATDRDSRPIIRGCAAAGITLAVTVVAATYSRSALAAALLAIVIPLFRIHSRRRAVAVLAVALVAAVPVCAYALSDQLVADDGAGLHRTGAELLLGAILLAAMLLVVGLITAFSRYTDATAQPAARLRLIDRGLTAATAAVPALIILWLLVNHRGPLGEISHIWTNLTSVYGNGKTAVLDNASRLGQLGNSRAVYWRQALAVGEHNLLGGAGGGAFFPAMLAYHAATIALSGQDVKHAHSYVLDTFASFGLIGIALNLALFLSWLRDARSAVLRRRGLPAGEGDARWALIGVVIAFGVSSGLDWTWYYPGVTLPALFAAGWIAGSALPLRSTATRLAGAGPRGPAPAPATPTRSLAARPLAILALTALVLVTLLAAWESLAPMRSAQSLAASQTSLGNEQPIALPQARSAVSQDPLSAAAREQLATVYGALSEPAQERAAFVKATQIQPDNPQPFIALGSYLLCHREFAAAVAPLTRATMLDLTDASQQTQLLADAQSHKATCS